MVDELKLISGVDVPCSAAGVAIHQPTIKEISYAGEDNFFLGARVLLITKNLLDEKDRDVLKDNSNFEIFMKLMEDTTSAGTIQRQNVMLVLALLFPTFEVNIVAPRGILLISKEKEISVIDGKSFPDIQKIIGSILGLDEIVEEIEQDEIELGPMAARIKAKLEAGRRKRDAAKGKTEDSDHSIYATIVSVLSVGMCIDINTLLNYTVAQLLSTFERFQLKYVYDMYIDSIRAGATNVTEPTGWLEPEWKIKQEKDKNT